MTTLLCSRILWFGIVVTALAFAASWGLRETYVEPSSAALACNIPDHPSWCFIRFAILFGQRNALFGMAALLAGGIALLRGGRPWAIAAAALAVAAIVNFNVEMGALALVLGLIAAARTRAPRDGRARA